MAPWHLVCSIWLEELAATLCYFRRCIVLGKDYQDDGQRFRGDVKRFLGLLLVAVILILLCSLAAEVLAVPSGEVVRYEGGGAGTVMFSGSVHASEGLNCDACHEGDGLGIALFSRTRGDNEVTMRRMEMGRSCGHCHKISMSETLGCDICHHK